MTKKSPPTEVIQIRAEYYKFLRQEAPNGRGIGSAKYGVYAFYDYDGEPIYVGQTTESLNTRLGRHFTGQRSDAVAKFVLDPFEVLDIEVWPLWDLEALAAPRKGLNAAEKRLLDAKIKQLVDAAEYVVFQNAVTASRFREVLNEGAIPPKPTVELPPSYRGCIVPTPILAERRHPDTRLARRAQTVASLARHISERQVKKGLRHVLLVQAKRLEYLAQQRLDDFADEPMPVEKDEDTGDDS